MSMAFFIIFIVIEIVQVVLTFTKAREKAAWLKTRAIVRLIEALTLLCIIVVPSTHMKWRFAVCMAVLIIRLLVAGISWLVRRNKATGLKSRALAVLSCIFSVIIVTLSLAPAFIFTNYNGLPTTGEFDVKQADAILVDESREDPFEADGSFREVPVHFFYPDTDNGTYPLIVFSHGAFGYYQSNFSTYEELASNGYVVAALDHPHHSFFTTDTQGSTILVDQKFIEDVMMISESTDYIASEDILDLSKEWIGLRTADENFVLDTIIAAKNNKTLDKAWFTENADTILNVLNVTDTEKIGLIGHSLGGAASVETGRERSDIDAVIDLDGTMLGERTAIKDNRYIYNDEPYPVPVLDFTKEQDYNGREQYKNESGSPYVNEYMIENAKDGKTVVFNSCEHMDFTDLPLISPALASMLGSSADDSEAFMMKVNGVVLNWFDYYLKGEGTLDIQAYY